jgi:citrate synthase
MIYMQETKDIGLRGIAVADTKICSVDGERGKLVYRGYDIDELAQYSTFEETVYLLLLEALPTRKELACSGKLLLPRESFKTG